jgi:hypothetical protein
VRGSNIFGSSTWSAQMGMLAVVHKAADGTQVEAGQCWAYRARRVDELAQVTVVRLGTQRPARVLVRFADEASEGRQEWVPPGRLQTPWERRDEFVAREARWYKIHAAGPPVDDPREGAAETVIDLLLSDGGVSMEYRGCGVARIRDAVAIAAKLGLEAEQLTRHPLAFIEEGVLIAPWEVTELVAATAARQDPVPVLDYVAEEERTARREAIHGRWYRGGRRSSDFRVEPEQCAAYDIENSRPQREILRSWCGAEATDRFDELADLRTEVRRVGEVAQAAISALRAAGRDAEAARLQRDLGTPFEVLGGDAR